jgi:hypothetical protein
LKCKYACTIYITPCSSDKPHQSLNSNITIFVCFPMYHVIGFLHILFLTLTILQITKPIIDFMNIVNISQQVRKFKPWKNLKNTIIFKWIPRWYLVSFLVINNPTCGYVKHCFLWHSRWKHITMIPFGLSHYISFHGCACLIVSHLKLLKKIPMFFNIMLEYNLSKIFIKKTISFNFVMWEIGIYS